MPLAAFDKYTSQARLLPALIIVLPLGLVFAAWFPNESAGTGLLVGLLTTFGLTALLAQIGRDLGKQKEKHLFGIWGGVPTSRLLSHRHSKLSQPTLTRYHAKLRSLLPDLQIPTPDEERRDPTRADQVYESCVSYLREQTRDRKRYPLIFEENINYGFRRNLWAMKAAGLALAVLGLVVCAILLVSHWIRSGSIPFLGATSLVTNTFLSVWWVFRIKPRWVRLAADAYAERLIGTVEVL